MMAQGFLFDKPLPKTDFEDRMMLGQYPDPEA
jgi:EAL domain-containing protein (putative c-di-GMP-specific phosphodiesterase class I)